EKNKAVPNPFINIHSNGTVEHVRELMVVNTCRMKVCRFPFDVQSCDLSLKSIVYPVTNRPVPDCDQKQSVLIYSIRMRRRSPIFLANFLLPIMILFCLDLASFLMSDQGGEKVSFKVTLLLAVTVMQLFLNDVLPSSSDEVPLIVVFSIGMFCLMLISLLETILVMYLIEKDSASEESNADKGLSKDCGDEQGNYDGDVKKWTHCAGKVSDEPPTELLSVAEEGYLLSFNSGVSPLLGISSPLTQGGISSPLTQGGISSPLTQGGISSPLTQGYLLSFDSG
ncbi:hypothetical protein JOQ06_028194, partial [Pogonophryne albipinna]